MHFSSLFNQHDVLLAPWPQHLRFLMWCGAELKRDRRHARKLFLSNLPPGFHRTYGRYVAGMRRRRGGRTSDRQTQGSAHTDAHGRVQRDGALDYSTQFILRNALLTPRYQSPAMQAEHLAGPGTARTTPWRPSSAAAHDHDGGGGAVAAVRSPQTAGAAGAKHRSHARQQKNAVSGGTRVMARALTHQHR